jgi:hypothetical protein
VAEGFNGGNIIFDGSSDVGRIGNSKEVGLLHPTSKTVIDNQIRKVKLTCSNLILR